MAFSDYHACDKCGDAKTFYDADMEPEWVDGHWRYGYAPGGEGYPAFPGYRVYALCNACEKTHEGNCHCARCVEMFSEWLRKRAIASEEHEVKYG